MKSTTATSIAILAFCAAAAAQNMGDSYSQEPEMLEIMPQELVAEASAAGISADELVYEASAIGIPPNVLMPEIEEPMTQEPMTEGTVPMSNNGGMVTQIEDGQVQIPAGSVVTYEGKAAGRKVAARLVSVVGAAVAFSLM